MINESVVVVGAGQAAAQLAMSLRQGGFTSRILVVGEEPYLPYQRPPLSKKFLSGNQVADALFLRPETFWHDHDVAFVLGTPVGAVNRERRYVALSDGREIHYGTLVFATGISARTLAIPGIDRNGVYALRRIDDVLALRKAADAARRVVIVGGGYIGLEVAAVFRNEGREVTVLEAEDRVLKRVTGETVSAFFDRLHRSRGVDIRLGLRVVAIEGNHGVEAVRIANGETLPADLVLIAAGAKVNDEVAAAAGVACHDGILVDEAARTDTGGIYAIGDCTRFVSRRYGRRLRLESVQNAIDQAKAAAASILGNPANYDPVPWFWSDQYEIKLQIAGLAEGYDEAVTIGNPVEMRFSVEYRSAGRLIAVDAVNDARAHMTARRRIADETANGVERAAATL